MSLGFKNLDVKTFDIKYFDVETFDFECFCTEFCPWDSIVLAITMGMW